MPDYLVGTGLPSYPSGLKDTEVALVLPLYRAINSLSQELSESTGLVQYTPQELASLDRAQGLKSQNLNRLTITAGEALGYGDMISLTIASGNIVANKATAADPLKFALACIDTVGGLANGQVGTALFMQGRTRGISGTVFGATYYLGVAGAITATAPTTDSTLKQMVGIGLGSAGFFLNIVPVGRVVSNIYKPSAAVLRVQYTDGTQQDHAV
jgi:hypothetical protein